MSTSISFGQRVTAILSGGQEFEGVFCGVVGDAAIVRITVWNPTFPLESLASFPMESIKDAQDVPKAKLSAPKVEHSAPKVEHSAPKVELSKSDFPELPKGKAPKVERRAPKVEAPKVEAPKVERSAPQGRWVAPDAEALERAAMETIVSRMLFEFEKSGLRHRMAHTTRDECSMNVSCPAFDYVDVGEKTVRASIPVTLGKRSSEIREMVTKKLGYVPPDTYIRFSWDFERDDKGRLMEKNGTVKVFLKW
jgi:hypothetical protein